MTTNPSDFDTILARIKEAYKQTGMIPIRGRWSDHQGGCCPGTALILAAGMVDVSVGRSLTRYNLDQLLNKDGLNYPFIDGYDGQDHDPNACDLDPNIAWAYETGRRVAEALGVADKTEGT